MRRLPADRGDQLDLDVGNHPDFKTDVEPGEMFLVPPAFVGCYGGDLDEGSYSLHRFVLEKLRPPVPPGCPDPILAYNLYLDVGGNKATEADVLRSAAVCRDLGFEAFMPDAMWFPGDGRLALGSAAVSARHAAHRGVCPRLRNEDGAVVCMDQRRRFGASGCAECARTGGAAGVVQCRLSGRLDNRGRSMAARCAWAATRPSSGRTQKTQWLVKEHRLDYLKHDFGPIATQCNKTNHRHHYGVDTSYWATLGYYQVQAAAA